MSQWIRGADVQFAGINIVVSDVKCLPTATYDISWVIDGDLWQQFKDAATNQAFYSPEFSSCDSKWKLKCCPNGDRDASAGHLSLYLNHETESKNIRANYQLRIVQADITKNASDTFSGKKGYGYTKFTKFDAAKWSSLTIQARIIESMTEQNGWIEWRIHGFLLDEFRNAAKRKGFQSPYFSLCGFKAYLRCYPNGWSEEGKTEIDVRFADKFETQQSMYVALQCEEAKYDTEQEVQFKANDNSHDFGKLFDRSTFRNHESVSFKLSAINSKLGVNEICNMQQKMKSLITKNENKQTRISSLSAKKQEQRTKILSLNTQNRKLEERINWLKTEEQEQRTKINSIRKENKELKKRIESIEAAKQRTMDSLDTEKETMRKQINSMDAEHIVMKQELTELRALKAAANDYLITVELTDAKASGIDREEEKTSTSPSSFESDYLLYDKHTQIIQEWNETTAKLEAFTSVKKAMEDDEDEKQEEEEKASSSQSAVALLAQYIEYQGIAAKQTERLHNVTTDEYLVELLNHQNALTKKSKEHKSKPESVQQTYLTLSDEYEETKKQRIACRQDLVSTAKRCNELIARENELSAKVQQSLKRKQVVDEELKALNESSSACVAVIKSYNEFMENNKKYIDVIKTRFDRLWSGFEAKWMQWTARDLVVWFKYKTSEMDTENIDWDKVEQETVSRNMSGKSLTKFSDLVFEFIGIKDFNVATHLSSEIEALREKYNEKNMRAVDQGKKGNDVQIPKEFLCPITQQIMQDPVLAFDGQCYERSAIQPYLKIHGKSPVTGEQAEYLIVFPNHKMKADIQKYVKENNIDVEQFAAEGGSSEGANETAYVG